jgi:hypothetical protein
MNSFIDLETNMRSKSSRPYLNTVGSSSNSKYIEPISGLDSNNGINYDLPKVLFNKKSEKETQVNAYYLESYSEFENTVEPENIRGTFSRVLNYK